MKSTGENTDFVRQYLIHESMLLVNTPGPAAGQLMPQRLRFTNPGERISLNVPYQPDDPNSLISILLRPPCDILEGPRGRTLPFSKLQFCRSVIQRYSVRTIESRQQPLPHGRRFQ